MDMIDKMSRIDKTVGLELPVLETLFSKVFHDLVSPVGAVGNGAELLEEMGRDVLKDATRLISYSARLASRRLEYFRLAYGSAGTRDTVDVGTARQVSANYFEDSKIQLDFPSEISLSQDVVPVGTVKVLMNVILVTSEMMSRGGRLSIMVEAGENTGRMSVTAVGDRVAIRPEILAALKGETPLDEVDAHTVQAFATGRFAAAYGFRLRVDQAGEGELSLNLEW